MTKLSHRSRWNPRELHLGPRNTCWHCRPINGSRKMKVPGRHLQAPPPDPSLWCRGNLAWAAGLFEGEGCFYIHRVRGRSYSRMTVTSTDRDVLERFRQIVGCGHIGRQPISPAAKKQGTKKRAYRWHVGGRLNVYAIGVVLFSWLGQRRRAKFREMIAATTAWQS